MSSEDQSVFLTRLSAAGFDPTRVAEDEGPTDVDLGNVEFRMKNMHPTRPEALAFAVNEILAATPRIPHEREIAAYDEAVEFAERAAMDATTTAPRGEDSMAVFSTADRPQTRNGIVTRPHYPTFPLYPALAEFHERNSRSELENKDRKVRTIACDPGDIVVAPDRAVTRMFDGGNERQVPYHNLKRFFPPWSEEGRPQPQAASAKIELRDGMRYASSFPEHSVRWNPQPDPRSMAHTVAVGLPHDGTSAAAADMERNLTTRFEQPLPTEALGAPDFSATLGRPASAWTSREDKASVRQHKRGSPGMEAGVRTLASFVPLLVAAAAENRGSGGHARQADRAPPELATMMSHVGRALAGFVPAPVQGAGSRRTKDQPRAEFPATASLWPASSSSDRGGGSGDGARTERFAKERTAAAAAAVAMAKFPGLAAVATDWLASVSAKKRIDGSSAGAHADPVVTSGLPLPAHPEDSGQYHDRRAVQPPAERLDTRTDGSGGAVRAVSYPTPEPAKSRSGGAEAEAAESLETHADPLRGRGTAGPSSSSSSSAQESRLDVSRPHVELDTRIDVAHAGPTHADEYATAARQPVQAESAPPDARDAGFHGPTPGGGHRSEDSGFKKRKGDSLPGLERPSRRVRFFDEEEVYAPTGKEVHPEVKTDAQERRHPWSEAVEAGTFEERHSAREVTVEVRTK